jgi:hypothetical protein
LEDREIDPERYHYIFRIRDDETGEQLNSDLEFHILELPKIKKLN